MDLLIAFLSGTSFGGFLVAGSLAYAAVSRQQNGGQK